MVSLSELFVILNVLVASASRLQHGMSGAALAVDVEVSEVSEESLRVLAREKFGYHETLGRYTVQRFKAEGSDSIFEQSFQYFTNQQDSWKQVWDRKEGSNGSTPRLLFGFEYGHGGTQEWQQSMLEGIVMPKDDDVEQGLLCLKLGRCQDAGPQYLLEELASGDLIPILSLDADSTWASWRSKNFESSYQTDSLEKLNAMERFHFLGKWMARAYVLNEIGFAPASFHPHIYESLVAGHVVTPAPHPSAYKDSDLIPECEWLASLYASRRPEEVGPYGCQEARSPQYRTKELWNKSIRWGSLAPEGSKADDSVPFEKAREYTQLHCANKWIQRYKAPVQALVTGFREVISDPTFWSQVDSKTLKHMVEGDAETNATAFVEAITFLGNWTEERTKVMKDTIHDLAKKNKGIPPYRNTFNKLLFYHLSLYKEPVGGFQKPPNGTNPDDLPKLGAPGMVTLERSAYSGYSGYSGYTTYSYVGTTYGYYESTTPSMEEPRGPHQPFDGSGRRRTPYDGRRRYSGPTTTTAPTNYSSYTSSNTSNILNVTTINNTSNTTDTSNNLNVTTASNMSNTSNMSSILNVSATNNTSNASNTSNISNVTTSGNVSSFMDSSNTSNVSSLMNSTTNMSLNIPTECLVKGYSPFMKYMSVLVQIPPVCLNHSSWLAKLIKDTVNPEVSAEKVAEKKKARQEKQISLQRVLAQLSFRTSTQYVSARFNRTGTESLFVQTKKYFEQGKQSTSSIPSWNANWKSDIMVRFEGEAGIDAGGLRKEWTQLVLQSIVIPQKHPTKGLDCVKFGKCSGTKEPQYLLEELVSGDLIPLMSFERSEDRSWSQMSGDFSDFAGFLLQKKSTLEQFNFLGQWIARAYVLGELGFAPASFHRIIYESLLAGHAVPPKAFIPNGYQEKDSIVECEWLAAIYGTRRPQEMETYGWTKCDEIKDPETGRYTEEGCFKPLFRSGDMWEYLYAEWGSVAPQGSKADDLVPFEKAEEYTALKCARKWQQDFEAPVNAMVEGFRQVIPSKDFWQMANVKNLKLLVEGDPEIDIKELMGSASFRGPPWSDKQKMVLEETLNILAQKNRGIPPFQNTLNKLLRFFTGSFKKPSEGYARAGLKFEMYKQDRCIPLVGKTCFNTLRIPEGCLENTALLEDIIKESVATEGFGLA